MTGARPIRAAVLGASGFVGGELCRLLLGHPRVVRVLPTSRAAEDPQGQPFERVHQNLLGCGLEFVMLEDVLAAEPAVDVAFFSTPTGQAMREARKFLGRGVRVVDLSADFRFPDTDEFRRAHGREHTDGELQAEAVCGITELYREQIVGSRLVANPGCYVIATILGLTPLAEAGLLDGKRVHVCAINGTSGAGANPANDLHHSNAFGSILPYNLDGHRHRLEMEARLREMRGCRIEVDLSTVHGSFARGIVVVATLTLAEDGAALDRAKLVAMYRGRYGAGHAGEHFVLVNDFERRNAQRASKEYDIYPQVARVAGSNFCHIGLDVDASAGAIKVVSVIDNLVKGAAGSAIQNMNLMLGFPEQEGLRGYGL